MVKSYCLKERKLSGNINSKLIKTKNGRLIEISNCVICGLKKAKLIKS